MTRREMIALALADAGCILDRKRSPDGKGFRLKLHEKNPDAPLSPIYLNLRTPDNPKPGPLTPELVGDIGSTLWEIVLDNRIGDHAHRVVGVPNAGDPLARAVSEASGLPLLTMEKEQDAAGRHIGNRVSGDVIAGQEALLIDDLITKADSKLEAIAALEATGLHVRAVYVVVDREQGGIAALEERGYPCLALFTLTRLLDLYVEVGSMSPDERDDVLTYLRSA